MKYYVKVDEEYRPYPTLWQAVEYNDIMDCDGVFESDDTTNKTQILIDASVEKYLSKKSKHIIVNSNRNVQDEPGREIIG